MGNREVVPLLRTGFAAGYRGYDSAGVAGPDGEFRTPSGRQLDSLKEKLEKQAHAATASATPLGDHCPPSERKRPSMVARRRVAMIHNGIIENFLPRKNG